MRTRVYVDGFNLFYGALKGTPFKWLDPVRLATLLVPRGYTIERLRYFTARVSGKTDSGAPARQQIYLKALATLPEVEVHYGRFLAKTVWRPITNLPVAGRRIETPRPVMLPEGDHPVTNGRPHRLAPALRRDLVAGPAADVAVGHGLVALHDVALVGQAAAEQVGQDGGGASGNRDGCVHGAVSFMPM